MKIVLKTTEKELRGAGVGEKTLEILVKMSEQEKLKRKQKQADGIANAMGDGVRFGRPCKKRPKNFATIVGMLDDRTISVEAAACFCGVAVTTFYRWLRDYRKNVEVVCYGKEPDESSCKNQKAEDRT